MFQDRSAGDRPPGRARDHALWRFVALDGVDLLVDRPQICGVIGPNGAGKTTLVNVMSGYYEPTGGAVILRGERVDGLRPHELVRRGLGRTFQVTRGWRRLTVLENLLVPELAIHAIEGRAARCAAPARPSTWSTWPSCRRAGAGTLGRAAEAPGARPAPDARSGRPRPRRALRGRAPRAEAVDRRAGAAAASGRPGGPPNRARPWHRLQPVRAARRAGRRARGGRRRA